MQTVKTIPVKPKEPETTGTVVGFFFVAGLLFIIFHFGLGFWGIVAAVIVLWGLAGIIGATSLLEPDPIKEQIKH